MPDLFRTPEERFDAWLDYPFKAHYHDWNGLRMHYLDEGATDRPVMLLVHGMPTSSYLYRHMIPRLVAAGYRCIAPDHVGFGRSDKPLDDAWYSIERHCTALCSLIEALDLERITLVCQDWGGPIGLRQVADMPARFERLTIMNTWLHHPEYQYTEALRRWNQSWHPGHTMDELQGCGFVLQHYVTHHPRGSNPQSPEEVFAAYEAPFPDRASKAGPRRFPLSLPFDNPAAGNAADQARCYQTLLAWTGPVHFVWGIRDDVFTEGWGRAWAAHYPQATFDVIDAGHFLQESHGQEIAAMLLERISEESDRG
jgi:haloalkane dehalogenase